MHFWSNTGKHSYQTRFADNLLDVEVNVGDISTTSFDSPGSGSAHLGKSKMFVEADSFIEEPTITQFVTREAEQIQDEEVVSLQEVQRTSSPAVNPAPSPERLPTPSDISSKTSEIRTQIGKGEENMSDASSGRQRKIKVNREVEKIVVSTQLLSKHRLFFLMAHRKKSGAP